MKMNKGLALVLCLLVAALFVAPMFAQETTAGLQGSVKDATGAVVSGAVVEVSSPAMLGVKKVETDASGYYRFANLPLGTYTISVTKQGFKSFKQGGARLVAGALPTIDLKLEVGGVEQVVEVSGAAPLVDVTVTKTQTNITEDLVNLAPQGRSFQSVINFAPGARNEPLQGGYSVAGAAQTENQYLIEGQDTGNVINGSSNTNTPFEFIQEVQVKSSGIEAEHAGALGGVINVIQKRGSNAWHGQLWTYYEPNAFDAAPSRFSRQDPTLGALNTVTRTDVPVNVYQPKKDKFLYIQPGVSIGGSILKDRLWIFASFAPNYYKRDRTVNMNSLRTTVYTPDSTVGPTTFGRHEETYYTTARVDYLLNNKIRLFGSWLYQYWRATGISTPNADDAYGLVNGSASDPMGKYLASMSEVNPNQLYNVGADITLTPNIVATTRFGHSFQNDGYRGFPNAPIYWWRANGTTAKQADGVTPVGGILGSQVSLASNYPTGRLAQKDANKKDQFTQDIAWFKKFFGTHNFKFGYQLNRLENDSNIRFFDSIVRLFPGRTYTPLTTGGSTVCTGLAATVGNGVCRGTYGYANLRDLATVGDLTSNNHGIYAQDAWTIGKGLTLNIGFRMDKEYLPADPALNVPGNRAIDFSWGNKFAPRFGAAWDVFQNGKMKVFGSYGLFFDQMKLGLARGSFGGEYWHDCVYALNTNDPTTIIPKRTGTGNHYCAGDQASPATLAVANPNITFIENIDYREGAGAGEEVDKGLKPYRQHESVLGADYQLATNWALEVRWDRRRLDRAIEDAGIISNGNEIFTIVNPGFGSNATIAGCATCPVLPKAIRDYDGVEFRLTKSMAKHWFGQVSYNWSRLWGNYSGLTSSDVSDGGVGGRLDPNNNRSFDEAYFMFDAYGKQANGLLATDRPHTFKAYGYYSLPIGKRATTNLGLFQQWFTGTPLTSYMDVAYSAGSAPTMIEGRSKWVDITTDANGNWTASKPYLRRTPSFSQSDLRLSQEFKVNKNNEAQVIAFEADITNVFNQRSVTEVTSQMNSLNSTRFLNIGADCATTKATCNTNPVVLAGYDWKTLVNQAPVAGVTPENRQILNSLYGQPLARQGGRTIRMKLRFNW